MSRAILASAVAALVATAACSGGRDPYNPGTPLGTFHVVGKITSNDCGAGVGATDPWEFDIRLATDPGTLYWVQGGPAVPGILDAKAHATMKSSDTRTIHDADPKAGLGFCSVTRDDAVDVTLAADEASFRGALQYTFSATDGSDCSDQISSTGGAFAALPCTTKYALTATKTAAGK